MPTEILHSPETPTCGCADCCSLVQNGGNATDDASLDPRGGGIFNGKPIFTIEQVAAHLNRTGAAFTGRPTDAPQTDADNSVINFGFFTSQEEMANNGYVYQFTDGNYYGLSEYFNFAPFSEAQRAATREAMQGWDDVAAVSFRETSADLGDINFGNLASAPTTQAYARLPFERVSGNAFVNPQINAIAGDVWISASQASNFRLDEGQYGIHTIVHEIGHSLGLSHPGAYNAAPGLSITYSVNAEYAQDTRAYSVMSYFDGNAISGTRHFDFNLSTTVFAATPLIHDIAAIQRIYGADMTTRTGDTTYGFNSNAGRDSYDFTLTPAPIMAIWDAGGTDTIDASGYATDQVIDLAPGSLSSIGGVTYDTASTLAQVNANRALQNLPPVLQATYDANMAALLANPAVGRLTDNVGIAYGATIENAVGGSGNDTIMGNSVDNVLTGNAGNDLLAGGAGKDTLNGGSGNDTLFGGIGDDIMLGGGGDDLYIVGEAGDSATELADEGTDTVRSSVNFLLGGNIENLELVDVAANGTGNALDNVIVANGLVNIVDGGAGFDTVSYRNAAAGVTASLLRGTGGDAAGDRYISIEAIEGSNFNDTLSGTNGVDVLSGLGGDDVLGGGNGNDVLDGGAGADRLDGGNGNDALRGGDGDDNLVSGNGDDTLSGGTGVDTINGGNGNDTINGGAGADRLQGGNGNDVFVFTDLGAGDVILDFDRGSDRIDLSGIDAVAGNEGDDAFTFIGDGAFTAAGQVRSYQVGGNSFIAGDVDGDGVADFIIQVNAPIVVTDFVLL